MSTTDTTPTLPGLGIFTPTDGRRDGQWRLTRLQVVNWGGFDGHHTVDVHPQGTLLSGASGTGKSTLLDAYTALMMDSNTPFNGASNTAGAGRARSATQRSVLSYVRGLVDLARDEESGASRANVLRGATCATWSAVAGTFTHTDGTVLTAMRIYYAPTAATADSGVSVHFAYVPGAFDLSALEAHAAHKFHHTRVKSTWPTLTFHESYAQWIAALSMKLSIGRDGDGTPALRLLSRIQAGRTINSVDTLFKEMVLETPRTYDAAAKAVEHFAALDDAKQQMATAQAQVDTLAPIVELQASLTTAQAQVDLLDTFGLAAPAGTPSVFTAWQLTTERALLEAEEAAANADRHAAAQRKSAAKTRQRDLDRDLLMNAQAQAENGAGELASLEIVLREAEQNLDVVRTARADFAGRAGKTTPTTSAELAALHAEATATLASFEADEAALDAAKEALGEQRWPLSETARRLREEREWLSSRRNLIPRELDDARTVLAEAAGLEPGELVFVAELIDLAGDHEQWRQAAELVLSGFARTLLVNSTHRDFRRRINAAQLRNRTNFTLVPTGLPLAELKPGTLPDKLTFDSDSPFLGWLTGELARRFDYECVPGAELPGDGRRAVTLTGQTQDGNRGAHGGHGVRHILGFSTATRLAEIDTELTTLGTQLDELAAQAQRLDTQRAALRAARDGAAFVVTVTWPQLDETGAADTHAAAKARYDEALAGNDVLEALRAQHQELTVQRDTATTDIHDAERDEAAATNRWETAIDDADTVGRALEAIDAAGIVVSEPQAARLAAEYDTTKVSGTAAELRGRCAGRMREALSDALRGANNDIRSHTTQLERIFGYFQDRWPQPNLARQVSSYDGYAQILTELRSQGLAQRRAEFTRRVIDWSSEDLLGLLGAYSDAFEEMTDRLAPVNEGLARLPFGAGSDQLRIQMRTPSRGEVAEFRAALRKLSSATAQVREDEVDERFETLRVFMARIAPESRERDHLLDVRRHVHIEAERLDPSSGAVLSVYDSLGGKSGGETQELAAFIVGAALRYRLGGQTDALPTFAPVLLDEAFIKADSEFAGRSIAAWQSLGFQLIVAAPLDKVSAIERYMDRLVSVVKRDSFSFIYTADGADSELITTFPSQAGTAATTVGAGAV